MPPRIRLIVRRFFAEGWVLIRTRGHLVFQHPDRPGVAITLPNHPADEISPGVYRDVVRKAGW